MFSPVVPLLLFRHSSHNLLQYSVSCWVRLSIPCLLASTISSFVFGMANHIALEAALELQDWITAFLDSGSSLPPELKAELRKWALDWAGVQVPMLLTTVAELVVELDWSKD